MGRAPEDLPPSTDRRNLLMALGCGAVNLVALRRFGTADARGGDGGGGDGRGSRTDPASPTTGSPGRASGGQPSQTPGPGLEVAPPPPLPPALSVGGRPPPPEPPDGHLFDIVIRGGRLIDPDSGFDGLANLGIDGDTITAVTYRDLTGRTEIEAERLVVAPGFVDLLSYEPNSFGVWLKLADGVTTNLAMHGVNNYADAFFGRYENQTPIHYGGAFHHHFLRGFDVGAEIDEPLTAAQLTALDELTRTNLAQGFAGISFSPEYSPGTTTEEMERLAEIAAEIGHVCFFHVRHSDPDLPGTSLEAIEEVLDIALRTRVSAHIEHLSSTGGTFVMADALAMINEARAAGADVTACLYPYEFWGTFLGSSRFSLGWQERYRLAESDLQIAGTGTRLSAESFGEAFRSNKLVAALGSIPGHEVEMALQEPWMLVASDAIPTVEMNNHPRGAGTFARLIGHYVRELGVIDLLTGLAKITIGPVRRVEGMIPAMAGKGRLQRGADADIVIFDPETIGDRATIEVPAAPSVGVEWVVVAGQVALARGVPDKSVLAGRPLPSGP